MLALGLAVLRAENAARTHASVQGKISAMNLLWTHAGAIIAASFLASLVEFVEALTIVLAVGVERGWRSALLGVATGLALLAVLVLAFGPLLAEVPIGPLQVALGVLLLLFGMRWLRKAVLRAAGVIALRDERAAFLSQTQRLRRAGAREKAWDTVAWVTSFKAVVVEGLEVVFIVLALSAVRGNLLPATAGAAAALLLVVLLGLAIHRPLARVPENSLKFAVGILLSAFGTFWFAAGAGLAWPGGDLAIPGLILGFFFAGLLAVACARRQAAAPAPVIQAQARLP
jgi:Ca2+/H+ antiporter, TMEM165/GDT1 family